MGDLIDRSIPTRNDALSRMFSLGCHGGEYLVCSVGPLEPFQHPDRRMNPSRVELGNRLRRQSGSRIALEAVPVVMSRPLLGRGPYEQLNDPAPVCAFRPFGHRRQTRDRGVADYLVLEGVVADECPEEVRIEGFDVLSEPIVIFQFERSDLVCQSASTTRPSDLARRRMSAPELSSTSTPSLPRGTLPAM